MTLVEILIVMVIMALALGAVVIGTGQTRPARLKKSVTALSGAIRIAYTRATATSRDVRLVMDLVDNAIWLEEATTPMLLQTKDKSGAAGADPATEAERQAAEETERIIKGPKAPRASFRPVEDMGVGAVDAKEVKGKGRRALDSGIQFREVQTAHDESPRTDGRAYLYFWPGGLTERASIQLRIGGSSDDDDTLTLLVSPLTGKTTVKRGPVPMKNPTNEAEASEREDRGY